MAGAELLRSISFDDACSQGVLEDVRDMEPGQDASPLSCDSGWELLTGDQPPSAMAVAIACPGASHRMTQPNGGEKEAPETLEFKGVKPWITRDQTDLGTVKLDASSIKKQTLTFGGTEEP